MKKILFLIFVFSNVLTFSQIGINTTTPKAMLEIAPSSTTTPSSTDGLLVPRISAFPVTNPTFNQQGMLIFLTATVGVNTPGFYYWNNPTTTWIAIAGASTANWQLTGNTATATAFMGSTNNFDVVFKRNNIRAGLLGLDNTSFGLEALNPLTAGTNNTAIGISALRNNSTGLINTAIGFRSLYTNTTGNYNVGIGNDALQNNTIGNDNLSIGSGSLINNTTGSGNSAYGNDALYANTVANNNIGIGRRTLFTNTTGNNNLAIGFEALRNHNGGTNNSAIGNNTSIGNTLTNATVIGSNASATTSNSLVLGSINTVNGATASVNVGIGTTAPTNALHVVGTIRMVDGNEALGKVLTSDANGVASWQAATAGNNWSLTGNAVNAATNFLGSTNDADVVFKRNNVRAGFLGATNASFGLGSLSTTGSYNSALGYYSLANVTIGTQNTATGEESLRLLTSGNQNTANGAHALYAITTGIQNAAFGYNSLNNLSTGSYNTAVGTFAFGTNVNFSNSTALGFNTVITASDQARIGNNAVTSIGGQVGWTTVSDARFKNENVQKVPGIDFIKKLRPVTYFVNYNAMNSFTGANKQNASNEHSSISNGANEYQPNYQKTLESGFMAQEVEQAAKELGYDFNGVDAPKNENDYYGLRYAQFVVPLVKAVQELDEKLEQKELENKTLKLLLLELEARISKLEKRG